MENLGELESIVHRCRRCRENKLTRDIIKYFPVFSFGDPRSKEVLIIGINPSHREYSDGHLSSSPNINERMLSQLTYFDRDPYFFFRKLEMLFEGEVQKIIGENPWSKVAFLDLVKCVTVKRRRDGRIGQWSALSSKEKQTLIRSCEGYLIKQLFLYKPKVIMLYGKDVCRWFKNKMEEGCERFKVTPMQQEPFLRCEIANEKEKFVTSIILSHQSQAPLSATKITNLREMLHLALTRKQDGA